MSFIKNILTTMMSGHHGYNKQNGYSQNRGGHHGQRYYEEPVYGNNTPAAASQVCSSCQYTNPLQAKFCGQCGQGLNIGNCTACGQKLSPGTKFCGNCGQAVSS